MQIDHIDRGLESLSIFPKEPLKKQQESDCRRGNGLTMDSLFSSSPTSSPSLFFGDSIGMESSVDILKDHDRRHPRGSPIGSKRDRRHSPEKAGRREFPPPIPLLARTGNLLSRMPWVLRRQYTADGRLILTEDKASRYEYFRAHRSKGRLTLHLVPLDSSSGAASSIQCEESEESDVLDQKEDDHDHDHAHEVEGVGDQDSEEVNDHDNHDNHDDDDDEDEDEDEIGVMDGVDEDKVNCLRYRSGSRCVVNELSVPAAIRPVHS